MTNLCIKIYRFFASHKGIYWTLMVGLFAVMGYCSSLIHLEEDINKLMPSSKNEDGSTKLAFADLRIKDMSYILFEGDDTDSIIACCDAFMDSLAARDTAHAMLADAFYRIPLDELMPDAIDYMTQHLPAYIDTSVYAQLDSLLTPKHMKAQMQQNLEDMQGEFGSAFPELLEMDPLGLRNLIVNTLPLAGSGEDLGGYITLDDHIFVADSSMCVAFISPAFTANQTGGGAALFRTINELRDKNTTGVNIWYHGTPAYGFYNSTTIKSDLIYTLSASLTLVLLILLFCFRRLRVIPLMVIPVAFGTLFALTMMYFLKGVLSLLALGIGGVILGVAMSYALHFIVHQTYVGSAEQVLKDETKPVLLGCITTIGAFIGIMFVETDLLRDFGLFASFAILGTTLFTLFFLPQLLPTQGKRMPKLVDKLCAFQADRSKWLVITVAILAVIGVGGFCWGGVQFDENMHHLSYNDDRVEHSSHLLDEKTSTGEKEKFFATSGSTMEEAIAYHQLLTAKLDSLQAIGLVKSYSHKSDIFIPLDVQEQRIEAWHNHWTPEREELARKLIAQTAPAADLDPEAFEPFFDLIHADYEADALYEAGIIPSGFLSTMMEKTYGGDYLCFTSVSFSSTDVDEAGSDYYKICCAIAGEPHMMVLDTYFYTRDTLRQLNADFNILQWLSLLFVLAVLFVSFHYNIRHSVLGFVPIAVSWLIVLGAMYLFGRSFNLVNVIISTFIFGVGVDYSIFVMNGLVSGETEKLHYHRTAILLSAIILLLTVGSMLLAKHPAIQSVGFSTLVGLIAAVVLSWVIQPALYRWTTGK